MPPQPFVVDITHTAQRELERLQPKVRGQILRTLKRLQERYSAGERPQDIRPIEGQPGSYGTDSGEYRVLYRVDEAAALIIVWRIGHRKDVYRNL